MKRALLIIGTVILADQWLKIWVKLNMAYGSEIKLFGDWAFLQFIENNGMAFGIELDFPYGKALLTIFRIVVCVFLFIYLRSQVKDGAPKGLIICLSLIFAGALGNIIDSAVYGQLFSGAETGQVAEFMPDDGGYAPLLHGKVVDMFSMRLIEGDYPEWFPERPFQKPKWMPWGLYRNFPWAEEHFFFFRPIFNIADAAISVGVIALILFQRSFFRKEPEPIVMGTAAAFSPSDPEEEE